MTQPLTALFIFAIVSVVAVLLFRPQKGWIVRLVVALRVTERVRVEDSLKHLYDCESHRTTCTLQSLSGALGRSGDRTAQLVDRLQQLGLSEPTESGFGLTAAGRREALRVIRSHRLWERYLAEETGVEASEWHRQADQREHTLSADETESLALRMGQPRYDPHGDPIPTASGEIVLPTGKALTEIAAGEASEIVHIEDEPEAIFSQLMVEGLYPGMRVRMIENTPRIVRFEAAAEEHALAPVLAGNVTVAPLAEDTQVADMHAHLSSLSPGDEATVAGLSPRCRGQERRRLLDLGVVPGTRIVAEMRSPSGDPTAYRIRGAVIALRSEQADLVDIESLGTEEGP